MLRVFISCFDCDIRTYVLGAATPNFFQKPLTANTLSRLEHNLALAGARPTAVSPGTLQSIEKCPFYGLAVQHEKDKISAEPAIVLVQGLKKSGWDEAGTGYTDVKDVLSKNDSAVYFVTGLTTKDNLCNFKFDKNIALARVTTIIETSTKSKELSIDALFKVQKADLDTVVANMNVMIKMPQCNRKTVQASQCP